MLPLSLDCLTGKSRQHLALLPLPYSTAHFLVFVCMRDVLNPFLYRPESYIPFLQGFFVLQMSAYNLIYRSVFLQAHVPANSI